MQDILQNVMKRDVRVMLQMKGIIRIINIKQNTMSHIGWILIWKTNLKKAF